MKQQVMKFARYCICGLLLSGLYLSFFIPQSRGVMITGEFCGETLEGTSERKGQKIEGLSPRTMEIIEEIQIAIFGELDPKVG